ncbi:MAG: N-6 DNA methylase, partial [Sciscionella sp.]
MKETKLKEIVSELLTRPGHEKVRGNLLRLLTDGLGAASTDITFEQQLNRFRVRGRIDALLGRTVFEVKSDLRREKKEADRQLVLYIKDREAETKQPWIGVATDGAEYYVAMVRDDKLVELGSFKPKAEEPRAILGWLESVLVLNVELPPDVESIRRELGRESVHYRRAMKEIEALWKRLETHPEAVLKRDLWNRLLRVAYGADIGAPILFLQHTYLTIVAKSVATAALTDNLPPNGGALLSGQVFRHLGIVGAIESDFFDWVLLEADGSDLVMEIARHANRFRLNEIDTDVLKGLYESLIDPAQRHDLGEYYTPDWLAERICEEAITDPLEQRIIDPACGSGTFLFHAVRRLLSAANRAKKPPAEAVALACEKVAGIDVHPVAVIFARATYLLALMPSLTKGRPASLGVPVYLGDSLQWNAREFMNQSDLEIVVPAAGESGASLPGEDDEHRIIIRFPATVAKEPGLFDAALEEMLNLAERGQPSRAVEAWLRRHAVTADSDIQMLNEAYEAFRRLQQEGRNHIWGYVARNLSRPIWLASEKQKADVVIGNPPWLAYRAMNKATQKRFMEEMKACGIWGGLSSVSAYDLSAYFFARAVQLYMRAKGKIAFVMPYAAMIGKPYALFLKGAFKVRGHSEGQVRFTAAWAFRADVKPLFRVPACVLWAERTNTIQPLPNGVRFFSGSLPCRDAHRVQAAQALHETLGSWPGNDDRTATSA